MTDNAAAASAADEGERLQKVLARIGVGSRRVSEGYIEQGRVTVNGDVARLGMRVRPDDVIAYDGTVLSTKPDQVVYLLNKPSGVVTTAKDPQGRPVAVDLVPAEPRVFPVGRLDMDTQGLLLLTNDGELTHRLTHPSFGVEKEYVAEVKGSPTRKALRQLREGVVLDDGLTSPAKASLLEPGLVRLTIHEGRNRQVRRMLDHVGHPVVRLVRTRIGPLSDPKLRPGQARKVEQDEILELQRAVRLVAAGEQANGS